MKKRTTKRKTTVTSKIRRHLKKHGFETYPAARKVSKRPFIRITKSKFMLDDFADAIAEAVRRDVKPVIQPKIWKTGDGTEMNVQDMMDSHLQNTICMLCRKLLGLPSQTGALGRTTWVGDVHGLVKKLDMMLDEAARRGMRV